MEIIPVIDLMHGLVVHARQGRRELYRPLRSPLCDSPEPEAVVAGLLGLHPFRTLYIADLDALMGRAPQTALTARLRRGFPDLELWIDQGWAGPGDFGNSPAGGNALPVIGSESLDGARLDWLADPPAPFILSLDRRDGKPLGPASLPERPELWPETLILMNLSRVGGGGGPDFAQAGEFGRRHPGRRWIAAGGVRHAEDLDRLAALGMAGVLLASALHGGAVDARVLERFGRNGQPA